jgi:hypothetical protein
MFIRQVSNPELVPVVELEPSHFGRVEAHPGPWSDEQCARYWTDCLTRSGLGHLVPVQPRSWLVKLDDLLERPVLRQVLRAHLRDMEDGDSAPFSGGFALYDRAEPLLLPQCCGDMRNLCEWQIASAHRGYVSSRIWVGHPELVATYVRPRLEIRYSEPAEARQIVSVDPYALAGAAERARAHLQALVPTIAASLAPADFSTPELAAATMLGLAEPA